VSHHALGGGSYAFKADYPQYLAKLIRNGPEVEVNLIIQPNSSPHFGTMTSIALAFGLAKHLQGVGLKPYIMLDLWDNAKAEQRTINGIVYQRGLRDTGKLFTNLADYHDALKTVSKHFGDTVSYRVRMEDEFLSLPRMPNIIRDIIHERNSLGLSLAPSSGKIALRSACPHPNCGLVDKYGVGNVYEGDTVHFLCPDHGRFSISLATECHRLQFNCQLFNLVIGRFYEDFEHGYIQICGSDYAGFWQEQLLWRNLRKPLLIVYTPLIIDWSGSKLSKSLYLRNDAYDYLCRDGLEYILSYSKFKEEGRDLGVLCDEVDLWIREPFRLFRAYSVQYIHMLFTQKDTIELGAIHLRELVNK
jgi:hypothetical protein